MATEKVHSVIGGVTGVAVHYVAWAARSGRWKGMTKYTVYDGVRAFITSRDGLVRHLTFIPGRRASTACFLVLFQPLLLLSLHICIYRWHSPYTVREIRPVTPIIHFDLSP